MITEEIIKSLKAHPERWRRVVVGGEKDGGYCKDCVKTQRWQKIEAYDHYYNRSCHHCRRDVHKLFRVADKRIQVCHDNGNIVLENHTPETMRGWQVVKPEFIRIGWWEERKLRAAILDMMKTHTECDLFDVEL